MGPLAEETVEARAARSGDKSKALGGIEHRENATACSRYNMRNTARQSNHWLQQFKHQNKQTRLTIHYF